MPIAAQPGSTSFGGQNGAVQIPLCAGQLEALSYDLFATAFNGATADHQTLCTKLSIAHALDVVAIVSEGLFGQEGFFGKRLAGLDDLLDFALP